MQITIFLYIKILPSLLIMQLIEKYFKVFLFLYFFSFHKNVKKGGVSFLVEGMKGSLGFVGWLALLLLE